MTLAIETHDLTVNFGGGAGVQDVSLQVERGEVFGFLGPNGAGKTTTIRMLLDLLRPDRGEARVLGVPARAGGGDLRCRLGFLPGDLTLPPGLTGAQTLDLFARLARRAPAQRDEALDRLGFPRHALTRRTRTYSTGMRQMIGITCALQHEPELLLLDEPTSGLDPLVRDAFLSLVHDCRARGQTVFLSSHVLDEVERVADRVGIIHRGRLLRVATVAELHLAGGRTITLRYRDGRVERIETSETPAVFLARLDAAALADVEIRPAGLDRVFRAIVDGDGDGNATPKPDGSEAPR